mgnify:FL=1
MNLWETYAKKLFPQLTTSQARMAKVIVLYNHENISLQIDKYAKSVTVDDVMDGEADSLNITLEDRSEFWKDGWLPERGAMLDIVLITSHWVNGEDLQSLPIGKFEIDEIECSGPPEEVKIKGVSIPNNADIRSVEHSQAWEKTKLSAIAQDIADRAGLQLFYDTSEDPVLDRAEETAQTDLSFLYKLCQDAGLCLKVSDEKIIIFDEQKYEDQDPVMTIFKGHDSLESYSIKATIHEVYKSCHVKYKNSKSGELIEFTYTVPERENLPGMTLEVNEEVADVAEAEKLAKKKLREKNREEVQATVTMAGNFYMLAGNTVMLDGFGKFNGKYVITKASHSLGNGYTVQCDLRRCLYGY